MSTTALLIKLISLMIWYASFSFPNHQLVRYSCISLCFPRFPCFPTFSQSDIHVQSSVFPVFFVFPSSISLVYMGKPPFSLFSLFSHNQLVWYSCISFCFPCFPRFPCFPTFSQSGIHVQSSVFPAFFAFLS